MTSRSKEKVAAAFKKLFRSSEKRENDGAGPSGSPSRRGLFRRHSSSGKLEAGIHFISIQHNFGVGVVYHLRLRTV
ncbi:unnamed protein product [Colias eurytheme]|nr:unnamed protein product [Colias eurytheme]